MNTISALGQHTGLRSAESGAVRAMTVQHGDTLSAIAVRFGVPLGKLLSANPQILNPDVIYPGDRVSLPAANGHTVRSGDTLSGIAAGYGVSLGQVLAANPQVTNPDMIYPGDRITIPGGHGGGGNTGDTGRPGGDVTDGTGPVTGPDSVSRPAPAGDADGVTPTQLQQIVPQLGASRAEAVAPHLNAAMAEAGIDTPQRQAMFIAQLAHESGGFHYMEEIASGAAYEGRADLGNTQAGDGVRFKGRGYIQVTGRHNYTEAGRALGLDLVNNPDLASRPENAARIAAWYWESRGINAAADAGDFTRVTRLINGGTNGLADRQAYYGRARAALS